MQNTFPTDSKWQPPKPTTTPATPKPLRPLTRKQQAFVKHLIDNPKDSATKAALATYGSEGKPVTIGSAQQIAHDNLSKPNVMLELAKYSQTAELVLIDMMTTAQAYAHEGGRDGAAYTGHAITSANSILDRLHGKATTKIEAQSTSVNINIDLTASQ